MIPALLGISGIVRRLSDRVTDARAAALDLLTSTRAGYIDTTKASTDTLLARLTSTRAAAIDTTEANAATVASRLTAARATGLDTTAANTTTLAARLTDARAGYLDRLNTGVYASVKSIQSGSINASPATGTGIDIRYVNITISAVASVDKAVVIGNGGHGDIATTWRLTSSTNLRASTPGATVTTISGAWTVVEFY